jgi:HEPN domain-containing protein
VNVEARRWLSEADEELAVARALREREDLSPRAACLHAHLSAEKAIKAALIERAITLRRSHDLFEIVDLLPDDDAALIDEDDLELLNPWAIQGRYPADLGDITVGRVDAVVAAAARVVTSITSQLT